MSGSTSYFAVFSLPPLDPKVDTCDRKDKTDHPLGSKSMALDFAAGCIGGFAGVLVGHPLDTVKVHLQTQDSKKPLYRGTWHCAKELFRLGGVKGLYSGITSPMVGIGVVNAIVFGIYGNVQRHTEDPNSLHSHFLAGSIAGLVQSAACSPMELAKTRMQLQHGSETGVKHKCPLDCMIHISRTEGVRGFFKGLSATALRDIPGFASYFVSYEYMMTIPSSPNSMHALLAGGFAGMFSWLACYPVDVVKTSMQADGMSAAPKYKGFVDCASKIYRADGLRYFFRGLNSTLIRAFPMNAACFFMVTMTMSMAKKMNLDLVVETNEPLAIVGAASPHAPLCHVHHHELKKKEMDRKRFFMIRSMKALGAFQEAVCHSEVEELAREFYPEYDESDEDDDHKYYVFEDKRLKINEC